MADITERKTPEEIKQKILEVLNEKPMNALEISRSISSNWSTVKNYMTDLIEEKKVLLEKK
jgi:predicted ArsR family transcriptional regulator